MVSLKSFSAAVACTAVLAVATPAMAQTVYFGENQSPAGGVSGAPVTARTQFLSQLSGNSTESFESYAQGTSPASLTFAGSAGNIVATFSGSTGQVCAVANCGGSGRYATDGTHFYDVSSTIGISFSTAIAAFGFYATDVGDLGGQLTVTLLHATGPNTVLTVNNTINGNDGSLLFWGVVDTARPFTGIQFGDTAAGTDFFGFDQMTLGDIRQVTGGVPEPTTWAMMVLGFGAVGGALRRRQKAGTRVRFA